MRDRAVQILRTTGGQLLALFVLVVLAVNVGGLLVVLTGDFDSYPEATWWAFRHVVDPGALADDAEWDERIIGTGLMVAGVVVFVGIVLALLTNIIQRSIQRLDESQVRVRARDHIVLLGWSWRVPLVLNDLEAIMRSDPAARRPVVVVAPAPHRLERDRLQAELRSHHRVFATRLLFAEDDDVMSALELAQVTAAHAVLVVPDEVGVGDSLAADVNVIARAAVLADRLSDVSVRPRVTYHVTSDRSLAAATKALPADFIPIVWNRAITGLLRTALFTPAWGRLLGAHETQDSGMDIDVVRADRFAGQRLDALTSAVPGRLPLGVLSVDGRFSTAGGRRLAADDLVVAVPADGEWSRSVTADPEIQIVDASPAELNVLIVGWNDRVPALIDDLGVLEQIRVRVTNASEVDADVRAAAVAHSLVAKTQCRFLHTALDDEQALAALLDEVRPDRIVVVSTLRDAMTDPERDMAAADAQAVITAVLLSEAAGAKREMLVDLYVPESAAPLRSVPGVQVLPAASVQANMLALLATGPDYGNVVMRVFGDDEAPPLIGRLVTADGRPRPFAAVRATGLRAALSVTGIVVDGAPWMVPPPDHPVPSGTELLLLRGGEEHERSAPPAPLE